MGCCSKFSWLLFKIGMLVNVLFTFIWYSLAAVYVRKETGTAIVSYKDYPWYNYMILTITCCAASTFLTFMQKTSSWLTFSQVAAFLFALVVTTNLTMKLCPTYEVYADPRVLVVNEKMSVTKAGTTEDIKLEIGDRITVTNVTKNDYFCSTEDDTKIKFKISDLSKLVEKAMAAKTKCDGQRPKEDTNDPRPDKPWETLKVGRIELTSLVSLSFLLLINDIINLFIYMIAVNTTTTNLDDGKNKPITRDAVQAMTPGADTQPAGDKFDQYPNQVKKSEQLSARSAKSVAPSADMNDDNAIGQKY